MRRHRLAPPLRPAPPRPGQHARRAAGCLLPKCCLLLCWLAHAGPCGGQSTQRQPAAPLVMPCAALRRCFCPCRRRLQQGAADRGRWQQQQWWRQWQRRQRRQRQRRQRQRWQRRRQERRRQERQWQRRCVGGAAAMMSACGCLATDSPDCIPALQARDMTTTKMMMMTITETRATTAEVGGPPRHCSPGQQCPALPSNPSGPCRGCCDALRWCLHAHSWAVLACCCGMHSGLPSL
jgi:hypothetical protein